MYLNVHITKEKMSDTNISNSRVKFEITPYKQINITK